MSVLPWVVGVVENDDPSRRTEVGDLRRDLARSLSARRTHLRELCGTTPASVRLAEPAEADVQRARESTPKSDAVDPLRSIRAQVEALEAFIRDSSASS
jgi:hypothetical protein